MEFYFRVPANVYVQAKKMKDQYERVPFMLYKKYGILPLLDSYDVSSWGEPLCEE